MEYFEFALMFFYDTVLHLICVLGVLVLIVFVHEIGHYLVARWCGISASVFSIGFGPEICGFVDKYGTRWRVAALPFGGYVRFLGDQDAAGFPSEHDERKFPGNSFPEAHVWKRAATVFAGPFFNTLFTVFVLSILFFFFGRTIIIPVVTDVLPDSPAARAGFKPGDRFLTMQGNPVSSFGEVAHYVMIHADDPVNFTIMRQGHSLEMIVRPEVERTDDGFGNPIHVGRIGIVGSSNPENIHKIDYNLFESFRQGIHDSTYIIRQTGQVIGRFIQGRGDRCQLSGPLRSAQIAWKVSDFGLLALLQLAAFFSISIGLFNLLPIPPLDGGYLIFYLLEGVTGRPVPLRVQTIIFRTGFILVFLFMVFTLLNNYISC
ncbi:MAG: Zinc metalloprotease [Candidatus Tokpelaia sp. JSC085]|nr:MAG: Zinc metalloprotease [Candidatus Tokpelaia sp. JSC085]